jgi:hypothetical protein
MAGEFLHVNVVVKKKQANDFAKAVQAFFDDGGFEEDGWKLAGAFRTDGPDHLPTGATEMAASGTVQVHHEKRHEDVVPGPYVTFVNLWALPEGGTVLENVMMGLADTRSYIDLDNEVARETQNTVYRITNPDRKLPSPRGEPGDVFVRIARRVAHEHLADYAGCLGAVIPAIEWHGWTFLGDYQNVTGTLNTFFEFWKLPRGKDPKQAIAATFDRLGASSELDTIREATISEARDILHPAGYWTDHARRRKPRR